MVTVRSGTFTLGSPLISGLSRTSDLTTGEFLYGNEIPVGTKILNFPALPADQTLNMTNNAVGTSSSPELFQITNAGPGVYLERKYALSDVQFYVTERGDIAEIFLRGEGDVTRDSYNSIEKRSQAAFQKFFRTFPVHYAPSDKQLEKAGIRERADVIIYTAFQDWMDAGKNFLDIDLSGRLTVIMQGETFEIKNKGLVDQFCDAFLYITLGLFKR
jgi:hypothetical protein